MHSEKPLCAPLKSAALKSLSLSAAFLLLLLGLAACASPAAALLGGMAFALLLGHPHPALGRKISKYLLQTCVVLLGFGMDLSKVLKAGASGAGIAAATITTTLLAGFWLGRRLGVGRKVSALIASGTAICGGSAIAAVGSVIEATDGEMGIAVGAIFLLNAAALFVFPAVGHALHLSQHQFGLWAGIGIHDISSVVGAASLYGQEALQTATAVKLSRVLWIIAITAGMSAYLAHARHGDHGPRRKWKIAIPWFIGLFLLASLLRSTLPAVARCSPQIDHLAKTGMATALCLIGAGISPGVLRKLGARVALLSLGLWLFISFSALAVAYLWGE